MKKINEASAKQEFEKRVVEAKRAAIEKNKKIARETGAKLTQNIDKNGNLVGINNTIENTLNLKEEVTSADIRKELFEGNNIEKNGAVKNAIERGLISPDGNIKINEKKD